MKGAQLRAAKQQLGLLEKLFTDAAMRYPGLAFVAALAPKNIEDVPHSIEGDREDWAVTPNVGDAYEPQFLPAVRYPNPAQPWSLDHQIISCKMEYMFPRWLFHEPDAAYVEGKVWAAWLYRMMDNVQFERAYHPKREETNPQEQRICLQRCYELSNRASRYLRHLRQTMGTHEWQLKGGGAMGYPFRI